MLEVLIVNIYLYHLSLSNLVEGEDEDDKDKNVWRPCKQTLYKLFTNHHDEFSLTEWQNMHPNQYEDYISYRYVLDGYLDELTSEERAQCTSGFEASHPGSGRAARV
jgi:hypothetical protein